MLRVVPGEDGVEAVVLLGARPDGMQAHSVSQLAEPVDRPHPFRRREVVEDALRHQEVGRRSLDGGLQLGETQRGVECEVDVVAEEQVAVLRQAVEG